MLERELRELSFVPRWSIQRRINNQSVAEHSYYVALYSVQIADLVKWEGDKAELMRCALVHDLPEISTGDIPGPPKRKFVDKQKLSDYESSFVSKWFPSEFENWDLINKSSDIKKIIKVADILDAVIYLQTEKQMGNSSVGALEDNKTSLGSNMLRLRVAWNTTPIMVTSGKWEIIKNAILSAGNDFSRIVVD